MPGEPRCPASPDRRAPGRRGKAGTTAAIARTPAGQGFAGTAAAIACTLALAGCGGTGPRPPVPDSTMVSVLTGLHRANARLRMDPAAPESLRDSVLAAHGLDSTAFAGVSAWYGEHPDALVAIYGAVIDRLAADRNP